jgi:RNA polymerase sigma-70 factor (ECF subfamily)
MSVDQWDDRRDRALLHRLATGDREALAILYDLHADRLFGHALSITRNRADAQDLVQSTFVRLAGLGPAVRGIRHPGPYLHRAVRTGSIDLARRQTVRDRTLADSAWLDPPATDADAATDHLAIHEALARLPLEQRVAVMLRVVEGLSFREIGDATGVATFTAASRYRIALARMRRVLESP